MLMKIDFSRNKWCLLPLENQAIHTKVSAGVMWWDSCHNSGILYFYTCVVLLVKLQSQSCSESCPIEFWVSPAMEISQPLWALIPVLQCDLYIFFFRSPTRSFLPITCDCCFFSCALWEGWKVQQKLKNKKVLCKCLEILFVWLLTAIVRQKFME